MNQYLSDKIKVMSALCIVLVLYIHSGFHFIPNEILGMPFNEYLQESISEMMGRCAVPMFYIISGYLFWRSILYLENRNDQFRAVFKKMKTRVRTLLVPYLIAALSLPLFYIFMEQIPGTSRFINASDLAETIRGFSFWELLSSLYYKAGDSTTPLTFQLWFLRDLILVVALSPVLLLVSSRQGGKILLILLMVINSLFQDIIPLWAMFWFMLGGECVTSSVKIPHEVSYTSIPVYIILAMAQMAFPSESWIYFRVPIIMIGCLALWTACDMILTRSFKPYNKQMNYSLKDYPLITLLCSYTFFVYLYHEPSLNIVRKLIALPFGHSSLGFAVSYLLSPWIFLIIATAFGWCMKRWIPRVYGVLVGGR